MVMQGRWCLCVKVRLILGLLSVDNTQLLKTPRLYEEIALKYFTADLAKFVYLCLVLWQPSMEQPLAASNTLIKGRLKALSPSYVNVRLQ
jgi:hypothetical protein